MFSNVKNIRENNEIKRHRNTQNRHNLMIAVCG
uniref:Uncharacterized protein n=1 Tax=Anguilla anguilla TaxID=7936 RepID=A0A0E9U2D0_ANGAN